MDGVFAAPDEMKVWDLIAKIQILQIKRILEVRIEFMSQFSKNKIIIFFSKIIFWWKSLWQWRRLFRASLSINVAPFLVASEW